MKKIIILILVLGVFSQANASQILIPMDNTQSNHLKAYGIAYWVLQNEIEVDWLLNYKGGSFMMKYYQNFENELIIRGVSYQVISDAQANSILNEIVILI